MGATHLERWVGGFLFDSGLMHQFAVFRFCTYIVSPLIFMISTYVVSRSGTSCVKQRLPCFTRSIRLYLGMC